MLQADDSLARFFAVSQLEVDNEIEVTADLGQAGLGGESDVALVMGGAALLDYCLDALLVANLVGDQAEVNWLLERGIRRTLAYCMGLIERRAFEDLGYVSRIRNRFAHSCPVPTFAREDVGYLVRHLRGYELAMAEGLSRRRFFVRVVGELAAGLRRSRGVI